MHSEIGCSIFKVEEIPDEDEVYYCLHIELYRLHYGGKPLTVHPKMIRRRVNCRLVQIFGGERGKIQANPSDNAVLGFIVGQVRRIPMDVKHDPIEQNMAHSLISKLSKEKRQKMRQRDELARIARWVIEF